MPAAVRYVDGRADALGLAEGAGDGVDEGAFAGRHALLHQRGEAADQVHVDLPGGLIQRAGDAHEGPLLAPGGQGADGAEGDAAVDDGYAVLVADLSTGAYQLPGAALDLQVYLAAEPVDVRVRAVEQIDAERDGAHVQVFLLEHAQGGHDVFASQHSGLPALQGSFWRKST